MKKYRWKFILLELIFYKNFFDKKILYFVFLLEFDLYIDFQSPDVVQPHIRSIHDFSMIFANDD